MEKKVQLCAKAAAAVFDVPVQNLFSKHRQRSVCDARQLAIWALMNEYELTSKQAAQAFNLKDHGTALHARNVVREQWPWNPEYKDKVSRFLYFIKF